VEAAAELYAISPTNGAPVALEDAVKEAAARKIEVTPDMTGLLRICSRLGGGDRDANLELVSAALGVDRSGKSKK
jgi:hypothetical protein